MISLCCQGARLLSQSITIEKNKYGTYSLTARDANGEEFVFLGEVRHCFWCGTKYKDAPPSALAGPPKKQYRTEDLQFGAALAVSQWGSNAPSPSHTPAPACGHQNSSGAICGLTVGHQFNHSGIDPSGLSRTWPAAQPTSNPCPSCYVTSQGSLACELLEGHAGDCQATDHHGTLGKWMMCKATTTPPHCPGVLVSCKKQKGHGMSHGCRDPKAYSLSAPFYYWT